MTCKDNRGKDFFFGAVVGGAVAALTTLLFTTKQGKKIQNKITDAFEDLASDAKEKFFETEEKVEDAAEHAHKKVGQHLSDAHHRSKNAKHSE
jgi:gas vesicle protein